MSFAVITYSTSVYPAYHANDSVTGIMTEVYIFDFFPLFRKISRFDVLEKKMKKFFLIFVIFAFSTQLFAEEKKVETYHPYKTAGISLIVAGAVIMAGGIAGFHFASDKEFDKYKKMNDYDNALSAIKQGEKESDYLKRADNYRKKANIYRSLEIAAGVLGGELLLTGIIISSVKKEKTEKVSLTNISVVPSDEGFVASAGFEF